MKFKKGDKVKVTGKGVLRGIGEIGEVLGVDCEISKFPYWVLLDGEIHKLPFRETELELIKEGE